ncbi:Fc.00g014670.m01.CDS01 [Cosmosporella sp. VM-42]
MRSLGERLNLLRKLVNIQCGPGAAILPPEVTRIHLDFARSLKGGHMGARKFWKENLPRLKYHNPSIPMIVNRHTQNDLKPTLSIYLRSADAAAAPTTRSQPASSRDNLSKAQLPDADERVVHIDMKDKHSGHILEYFLAETRAVVLQPTKEEIKELQELEAMRKEAEVSRERMKRLREEKKREEDMLKRARAAGGMAEEDDA